MGKSKDDPVTALSKALSRLLRHSAIEDGVAITPDGWVKVSEALAHLNRNGKKFAVEDVARVVDGNDKQRFSLRGDGRSQEIRANQGHSMEGITVDMKALDTSTAPRLALHGTYYKAWPLIREGGLSRMSRLHIHFARDLPGESGVISGMRGSCELVVFVDVHAALSAGMQFFESSNGVILTDGFDGCVPPAFFNRVADRKTGHDVPFERAQAQAAAGGEADAADGPDRPRTTERAS